MKVGVVEAFAHTVMAAIGTKRTYRVALHMSAFGAKADNGSATPRKKMV